MFARRICRDNRVVVHREFMDSACAQIKSCNSRSERDPYAARVIHVAVKIAWALVLLVVVPVYAVKHGYSNFLWLSDIALLAGFVAAWRESARLNSALLVAVLLFEIGWLLDFAVGLIRDGSTLFGLVDYMFDAGISLFVRSLSLFHVPLPFVLLWMAWRLGYDARAFHDWIFAGWVVLALSFVFSNPQQNVNWVFGPPNELRAALPAYGWLLTAIATSSAGWWLTHQLLQWLARRYGRLIAA